MDLPTIVASSNNVLSVVASKAGGTWLRTLLSIDAVVVLSGGVLTAFVGVTGLIKQLAADRCLPSVLLQRNHTFDTHHWIIFSFFLLTVSLYLMSNGDVLVLSGVFAIAFLMVLIMFALANMRLKFSRPRLPRAVSIGWTGALFGYGVMLLGVLGNIIADPSTIYYFGLYLLFFFSVIYLNFSRLRILKVMAFFVRQVMRVEGCRRNVGMYRNSTPHVCAPFSFRAFPLRWFMCST